MSQSGKAKRHHYVPRCYLKNFLEGDHVFTLDFPSLLSGKKEKPKMKHPNAICIDDQYYSILPEHRNSNFRLSQYDELFIESEILHEMENRYHKIFTDLTRQKRLCMADAIYLCTFLVQMKTRNPYWAKEVIDRHKGRWIEKGVDKILAEKGPLNKHFNRLPPELRQLVIDQVKAEQHANKTFTKEMQFFGLIQRGDAASQENEKFRKAIIDCRWILLTTQAGGPKFITSDNPGFAKTIRGEVINSYFGDDSVFYLPISPACCLMIDGFVKDRAYTDQHLYKEIMDLEIGSEQIFQINSHTTKRINFMLIAGDAAYLEHICSQNRL